MKSHISSPSIGLAPEKAITVFSLRFGLLFIFDFLPQAGFLASKFLQWVCRFLTVLWFLWFPFYFLCHLLECQSTHLTDWTTFADKQQKLKLHMMLCIIHPESVVHGKYGVYLRLGCTKHKHSLMRGKKNLMGRKLLDASRWQLFMELWAWVREHSKGSNYL